MTRMASASAFNRINVLFMAVIVCIVGAIVTTEALKDPKISKWLASTLRKNATRDVDQKEIAGLLADLDARAQSAGAGEA